MSAIRQRSIIKIQKRKELIYIHQQHIIGWKRRPYLLKIGKFTRRRQQED